MNNETIQKRLALEKVSVINQLKKMPIVQIAVEKSAVSRASYYRWRNEDKEFAKEADLAIAEGTALITDISEAQVINLIREKNFNAISLWLKAHHPTYTNKININATVKEADPLTPEQESLIQEALGILPSGEK